MNFFNYFHYNDLTLGVVEKIDFFLIKFFIWKSFLLNLSLNPKFLD